MSNSQLDMRLNKEWIAGFIWGFIVSTGIIVLVFTK